MCTLRHRSSRCGVAALTVALVAAPAAGIEVGCAGRPLDEPAIAAAWQALRVIDCARCHGRDYEGLAAPSIVAYARDQDRSRFERIVLDGDLPRGMPGYRANALVAERIDGLYAYFVGRARGNIAPRDRPGAPAGGRCPRRLTGRRRFSTMSS